jgi:hypothetical protein
MQNTNQRERERERERAGKKHLEADKENDEVEDGLDGAEVLRRRQLLDEFTDEERLEQRTTRAYTPNCR